MYSQLFSELHDPFIEVIIVLDINIPERSDTSEYIKEWYQGSVSLQ